MCTANGVTEVTHLEELASVAKQRGYEYIAITDHSKGLGIARGLNEERLMEEKKQ